MRLPPPSAWPSPSGLPDAVRAWGQDMVRAVDEALAREALERRRLHVYVRDEAQLAATQGALGQEAYAIAEMTWWKWDGSQWRPLFVAGTGNSVHNDLSGIQGGGLTERYHLALAERQALVANMPFTAGRVFYADASGWLAGSASLVWDYTNSRLGVGVSSPSARLHIGGDAYVDGAAGAQVRVRGVGSADSYAQVRDASASQGALDKRTASGVSYLDLNPLPADGASQAQVRLFRDTSTSGAKYVLVHPGDGSANQMVNLTVAPGAGGVYSTLTMFTYSDTAGEFPSLWLRRSRGSPASPAAVQSGDTLGAYRLAGYDGSSAIISGEITASATENWSASGRGADLLLLSTLAGTTSRVEGLRLRGAQALVRDGTASAPGLGFRDETGTGLYRYGSGVIGFTVGGTGQWLLSATALYPLADNSEDIGTSTLGVKTLYIADAANDPGAEGAVTMHSTARAMKHRIGTATHFNGTGLASGPSTATQATFSGPTSETFWVNPMYTIPGSLWAAGKLFRVYVYIAATGTPGQGGGTIRFRVRLGGTSGTVIGMCEFSFGGGVWYWNGVLRPVVYCRTRASGGQIRYSSFSEQVSGAGGSIGYVVAGSLQGVLENIGDAPLNTTADQALVLSYEVVGTTPGSGTIDLKYWAVETLM